MTLTTKEIKQRYFDKKLREAEEIFCACGCKTIIKEVDRYGRKKVYVNGHNGRKYEDPQQYKREWGYRNRKAKYEWKKARWRAKKAELLFMFGGRCSNCFIEYNKKNACIFHFHHLDKSTKLFNVGHMTTNKAWKTVLAEAVKCILLCANCHEMRHSAEF